MPYSPEPTPPKITSLSWIMNNGTSPPSGVKESCIELTEPFEAAVVAVAHIAELTMPTRTSLPSIFPPGCRSLAVVSTPSAAMRGLPDCSAHTERQEADKDQR